MCSMINRSKQSNHQRTKRKKNDCSPDDLPAKMADLCHSINNLSHQPDVPFEKTLELSNSSLGKLYHLFLTFRDEKDHLVHPMIFNELLRKKTEGLIIQFDERNKRPMNFIQLIEEIELLAKENRLSKEYLSKKLLHPTFVDRNSNQNNNALDTFLIRENILSNEYNTDFVRLKTYFMKHSGMESNDRSDHQMNCSTFIKCVSENVNLNPMAHRLQLNEIFNGVYSSLVHEGVYIPASHTIDFHGFLLCLEEIARTFPFNLRILVKSFISPKK